MAIADDPAGDDPAGDETSRAETTADDPAGAETTADETSGDETSRVTTEPSSIRCVGAVLPADVLAAVAAGELPGLDAEAYHSEVSPREAANRAWAVLTSAWSAYRSALAGRPEGDPAVALTRERWSLVVLRELGFGRVPPSPSGGIVADGRSWPVSHCAPISASGGRLPVHLLGWDVPLGKRTPGMAGAAERAPQAMLQDLLSRSDELLWAILSNGATLRLLRDSSALVGPAYVEVDLQAIFETEAFSDFVVAWLVCHQSRFEPAEPDAPPSTCWLERWRTHAAEVGARALGALRAGVHDAIEILGTGFASHPANVELRAELDCGRLAPDDYQRALLRLVYRLMFCFVAEDRGQLLYPADSVAAARYRDWYSTARIRRRALRRAGDHHDDCWVGLRIVLEALGKEDGCAALALPGLGGLFEPSPADLPAGLALHNADLLSAIRSLCVTRPDPRGPRRVVDYRRLGAEELGGIYESLLEFVPRYDPATHAYALVALAGNDRKRSGSYYTPSSLTECLLDSALDPLIERAASAADPEAALLGLSVCDPACGSGHFLVAAARRIAGRLAALRSGDEEPTDAEQQAALHDVVTHCCYGVDLNPLAAELAKVSLWLEGLHAGAPLGLLDAHVKVGNALLGATPALVADGIPDSAFSPIEGDERSHARYLEARNRKERAGHDELFPSEATGLGHDAAALAERAAEIERLPARSLAEVHAAERRLADLDASPEARRARLVADAWCAAFVLPKVRGAPELTQATVERIASGGPVAPEVLQAIEEAAASYRFFHWHLELPTVFAGDERGFDCVVGNPPWDQVQLDPREFFATRLPEIADQPNMAARDEAIGRLRTENTGIYQLFLQHKRQVDGVKHFVHDFGRFPLTSYGRLNTYSLFAEHFRALLDGHGRCGLITPTGIATDAFNQHYFKDLVSHRALVSLYDFENRDRLFEAVDSRVKFCLLTLTGAAVPVDAARFAFFARHPDELGRPGATFTLTPEEIGLLNPNTGTCPVFRTRRDAEITLAVYRRHPVLVRKGDPDGNPWAVRLQLMFMMNTDSHLFRTADGLEANGWEPDGNLYRRGEETMLPLYEGKMVHHYDHRWATYDGTGVRDVTDAEHADPELTALPRYWVPAGEVDARLAGRWEHDWLLGYRNICRSTDERTLICAPFPRAAVGDKLPLVFATDGSPACLAAMLSSFAVDYVARQKLGGTSMSFFYVEQLPVPRPETFAGRCPWAPAQTLQDWVEDRVDELIFTAWDMAPAALALGDDGAPFVWDPERRAVLRAELDAAMLHLYGIGRDDADYILGTFTVLNRNDAKAHGEERTRRLVLDCYDRIAAALALGRPWVSSLDPPPGEGARHPEAP